MVKAGAAAATRPRGWAVLSGLGMAAFSALTVRHFFQANYPTSIYEGSFCDINAFFNCDSSAFSSISAVAGVPLGWFGFALGGLVLLEGLFASRELERTTRGLVALNVLGVLALLLYSVAWLRSLCLLCTGFYLFSLLAAWEYLWRRRHAQGGGGAGALVPAAGPFLVFAVVTLLGAAGMAEYHQQRRLAQVGGIASRVVAQYYSLPRVPWPSTISPFLSHRSTEDFHGAPVRIVEYGDPLCIDCQLLHRQMTRLVAEFPGRINVAYQFFPLEAACNDVVDKDKHPGACEMSYMLACSESDFAAMLDEVYENMQAAKDPTWRRAFAARWGVTESWTLREVQAQVRALLVTGAEYERTHEAYEHGIRSTPTMIINNRMVIGTLPYEQLRAIVQALLDEHARGEANFIEGWEPTD